MGCQLVQTVLCIILGAVCVFTFDDVCNVMIGTDKCSVNGTLDAQLLLHSLGVPIQMSVGLTDFVKK